MSVASTAPDSACGGDDNMTTSSTSTELSVPLDAPGSVKVNIRTFEGECPQEGATWLFEAHTCEDRRRLSPWTLRYAGSPSSLSINARRNEVQEAIWKLVADEMKKKDWKQPLPAIIVDNDPLDAVKRNGCVDVIFASSDLWQHMSLRLSKIQVETTAGAPIVLTRICASSGLPGDVMPLDLLRVPVTSANSKMVLKSLNTMVAGVGKVTGIATATIDGSDTNYSYGIAAHRAYVKLSPASMLLPFEVLVKQLCTHFIWEGTPYTLYYPGRSFHKEPVYSANFTAEE